MMQGWIVIVQQKKHSLAKNRKAHLEFAKAHRNWTVEQWRQILWLGESKFNLKGSNVNN